MSNAITVVCSFNDSYAELAAVSLFSLLYNTKRDCDIHIFENTASEGALKKLLILDELYANAKITIHHIPDEMFEEVKDERFGKEIWYSMLSPEILPDNDKALVLDADTLVCRDISELYDIDMGKHYIAAWSYSSIMRHSESSEQLHINYFDYKFNTGVMLFNLKAIRNDDVFNRHRLTEYVKAARPVFEQRLGWSAIESYLSTVLDYEHIICLPFKYNSIFKNKLLYLAQCSLNPMRSFEECYEAITDPVVIHYVMDKPNHEPKLCIGDFRRRIWWEYLALSPFADPEKDKERESAVEEKIRLYRDAASDVAYYREHWLPYDFMEAAEKLKELSADGMKIIVYGAGDMGSKFARLIRFMGAGADAVCDCTKCGSTIDGLKIKHPDVLENFTHNGIVVIAIENPRVCSDVMGKLRDMGYAAKHILPIFEHLWANGRRWNDLLRSIEA